MTEPYAKEEFWRLQNVVRQHWFTDVWPTEANQAYEELRYTWPTGMWPVPHEHSFEDEITSVAIVGKAHERFLVPWGQPGYEFWGLNQVDWAPPVESYTRWFQLHNPVYLGKHSPSSLEDLQDNWTKERDVRLYMDRHYKKYPASEPYPKVDVEALAKHGAYHTSSFDWMVALAVLEGFDVIELYGCEFYTPPPFNGEPLSGRPCLEYWCGVAEGRGIEVRNISRRGDMFKTVHMARMQSDLQYGFGPEPGLDLGNGWRDLR